MNIRQFLSITATALVLVACTSESKETAETSEAGMASQASVASTTYALDQAASSLAWTGRKAVGDSHNGVITIKEGSLSVEGANITAGRFVVDMTTIQDLDIENEEYNGKLVGHLSSDDFFAVATYPDAVFEVTGAEAVEGEAGVTHHITGNLTLKGITNQIKIPANVSVTDGQVSATAEFAIDRSKWDVRYGSGSFFDDLGDKLIEDDINFVLNLVTVKSDGSTASAE